MRPSLLATSVLVLGLGATTLAGAQSTPAPSPTPIAVPTLPPNATNDPWIRYGIDILRGAYQNQQARQRNSARGVVTYFRRFDMQVQVGPNDYRNVRLHQGTIINPRGGTPSAGTTVDVSGVADASGTIEANSITIVQ